ncbi:MAG: DNA polymerase III subunit beta [Candidatus Dependentiae bacterium]|nr:DNA polymerase III subunit beta [Candidatus Dependentiae bacterium]
MKNSFVVEQKTLFSILSSMQPICTKRTALDTTTYIHFQVGHKELVLKSTDLEISLQASQALKENDVLEQQTFLVLGKRIFELVKELEGDITFNVTDNQLHLTSGAVHLSLNIKNTQDFPPFPERIENLMHLDAPFLMQMLGKVSFLIPQTNANPALNGLFWEITDTEFKMTATDGHCLSQVKTNKYTLAQNRKWLLPRRAIFELKKIVEGSQVGNLFLGVCGNQLVFSGDSFNFFTKLLHNTFPEYKAILERDQFMPAQIDRPHFIKTLRRSACLLSGQFIATTFGFRPDMLKVSMHNKEVGQLEENVPLSNFKGQEMDVRFYAPYLLSGLHVFSDEKINFYLKNSAKPVIFESEDNEFSMLYLVMPVAPTHV